MRFFLKDTGNDRMDAIRLVDVRMRHRLNRERLPRGNCRTCGRVTEYMHDGSFACASCHPVAPIGDPEREARIRLYEERAALGLPLFESGGIQCMDG